MGLQRKTKNQKQNRTKKDPSIILNSTSEYFLTRDTIINVLHTAWFLKMHLILSFKSVDLMLYSDRSVIF